MSAQFIAEVASSDLLALTQELTRVIVPVNYDRVQAGKGRSQAFGIIRRWSYRPHLSRNTWMRPKLWQLLLDYAAKHVAIPWDGCTVNDSYLSAPHRDKGNQGQSYTISFGDFTGGELCLEQGDSHVAIDTKNKGYLFDGSTQTHWTAPFEGRRFCLVFYSIVWPTKFLPRYSITCKEETDGLLIQDEYDQSEVVVNRKGHVVRILKVAQPREWIGRLTRRGQPSRVACIPALPETPSPVSHLSESSP